MKTRYMQESMRQHRTLKSSEDRQIDRKRTASAKQQTRTRKQQRAIKRGI